MWFKYDRELCGLFTHKSVPVIFEPPFIYVRKVKIKVTLVQALRFCTGRTAHRGSRGIALPFHDHGTRKKPLFILGKDPVPIVQKAGWPPGPVWTGAENLAPPPGLDPRTVQPVAQSLYRLSYRAHTDSANATLIQSIRDLFLHEVSRSEPAESVSTVINK